MSRLSALDLEALRGRLEYSMRFDVRHVGSLYLYALACCYLASDNDTASETLALENIFQEQAKAEGSASDVIINALLMAVPNSEVLS